MLREPCDLLVRYATAFFVDQLNSVPSIHMRCRITASLRADGNLWPCARAHKVSDAYASGDGAAHRIRSVDNYTEKIWLSLFLTARRLICSSCRSNT